MQTILFGMSYEQITITIVTVIAIIALLVPVYRLIRDISTTILIDIIIRAAIPLEGLTYWLKMRRKKFKVTIVRADGTRITLNTENEQSIREFLNALGEDDYEYKYNKRSEQQ